MKMTHGMVVELAEHLIVVATDIIDLRSVGSHTEHFFDHPEVRRREEALVKLPSINNITI